MKRKTARANNAFLLGSLILIVLVLVIIVLFMFMAFKIYDKKDEGYSERYDIVLGTTTLGNPLSVYVNDSLIFDGTPQSALTLSVGRFTEESTLLIVDGKTDMVSTIALPDHSETIRLGKREDKFFRE
jgi:hypothetical protein